MGDDRPVRQDQFDKLSDKIDNLTKAIGEIHVEMEHTRGIIRDYNGLREKLDSNTDIVNELKRSRIESDMRRIRLQNWGPWVVVVVTVALYLVKIFHG